MPYKTIDIALNVDVKDNSVIDTSSTLSTLDIKTAKLIFNITKDGVSLPLSGLTPSLILLSADGSGWKLVPTIDDAVNGIMSIVLPGDFMKHAGSVKAELDVNYADGSSMFTRKFNFNIDRSFADQDLGETATLYIQSIEAAKNEWNNGLNDLQTKFSALQIQYQTLNPDNYALKSLAQMVKLTQDDGNAIVCNDLNAIYYPGFYLANSSTVNRPTIDNSWYHVHMSITDENITQIAVEINSQVRVFSRTKYTGGTVWTLWKQLEDTAGSQLKADAAKQGAIDWAKSFGLGTIAKRAPNGSNANDLLVNGFYDGQGLVNAPESGWKKYLVINSGDVSNKYVTQLAFSMNISQGDNSNKLWIRQRFNDSNDVWTPWRELAGKDDIDAIKCTYVNPSTATAQQIANAMIASGLMKSS
ncbi:MAG: prophage xkdV [Sphingobacterium sp.]|jgi:hypothetical protein|nr:prophage xkdV [Sphingobacterium sp.]